MKPFIFTRIQYNSGDWDTDQRMPVNILNSLVEYTTIPIDEKEKVVLWNSFILKNIEENANVFSGIFEDKTNAEFEIYRFVLFLLEESKMINDSKNGIGYHYKDADKKTVTKKKLVIDYIAKMFLEFVNNSIFIEMYKSTILELIKSEKIKNLSRYNFNKVKFHNSPGNSQKIHFSISRLINQYFKRVKGIIELEILIGGKDVLTEKYKHNTNFGMGIKKNKLSDYFHENDNYECYQKLIEILLKEGNLSKEGKSLSWNNYKGKSNKGGTQMAALLYVLSRKNLFNHSEHKTEELFKIISNSFEVDFQKDSLEKNKIDISSEKNKLRFEKLLKDLVPSKSSKK